MAREDFGAGDRLLVVEALPWALGKRVKGHLFYGNRGSKINF